MRTSSLDRAGKSKKNKKRDRSRSVSKNGKEDRGCSRERQNPKGKKHVERNQERTRKILEGSFNEREKKVQRTLANHLRDRDKEREHHERDEAIRNSSAQLADLVRNADLTWKEVKRQLRKVHRWELVENLEREDRKKIFNENIDAVIRDML